MFGRRRATWWQGGVFEEEASTWQRIIANGLCGGNLPLASYRRQVREASRRYIVPYVDKPDTLLSCFSGELFVLGSKDQLKPETEAA